MTTQSQTITTRVSEDTKADFIKLAENHGLTESELLRLIIANAINNKDDKKITPKREKLDFSHMRKSESELEITALKIYLPKFLIEQAKAKAKTQGIATTRWIKSLVQSNLMQTPVLTDSAINAIKESNRELAAIGNNLNQIARKINESAFNIDIVKMEKLDEVNQTVLTVRASIVELIRISRNVYGSNQDLKIVCLLEFLATFLVLPFVPMLVKPQATAISVWMLFF